MTMSPKDGEQKYRLFSTRMSDEQIARLTPPELIELIKRLIEEVEIRAMQNVR